MGLCVSGRVAKRERCNAMRDGMHDLPGRLRLIVISTVAVIGLPLQDGKWECSE